MCQLKTPCSVFFRISKRTFFVAKKLTFKWLCRQQTREQLRIAEEERQAKAREAEQSKPAVSARQCAEAKDTLRSSLASTAHYDLDKDGNRIYSSSEEIEAYREKIRQFIAKNCR